MIRHVIVPIDDAVQKLIDAVEWPEGVPVPRVDAVFVTSDGHGPDRNKVFVRFAPPNTPATAASDVADFSGLGDTPMLMIRSMGALADAWCLRHDRHPGTYPTSPRAQIARALDLRTAGAWSTSIRLAAALASPAPSR